MKRKAEKSIFVDQCITDTEAVIRGTETPAQNQMKSPFSLKNRK